MSRKTRRNQGTFIPMKEIINSISNHISKCSGDGQRISPITSFYFYFSFGNVQSCLVA